MYYRYKNNNNKDDISYSFSLESYIDSLNNDYSFNDYKIKVNNKTYDELSIEHNRLHNEINKLINEDFNKYSEEDLKDNLSKFWNWVKMMFDKFLNYIQVFIKRIIAKIYEIALRFSKKETIYQNFNNKVFTSINVNIKDKKLNPKIIDDMNEYLNLTNNWINKIELKNTMIRVKDKETFNEVFNEMIDFSEKINNTKSVEEFINNIFYSENKKSETTIREYFGCNVGETPKAIIILSDEYTKRLVENKKMLEKWLSKLKYLKNEILNISKENPGIEVPIEPFKKLLSNINYFNNMNYSFFITALKVRKRVAKYVAMGCLGEKIMEQMAAGVHSGKPFKITTYYGMDFEQWRDIPDSDYTLDFPENEIAKVHIDSDERFITITCKLREDINTDLTKNIINLLEKHAIGQWSTTNPKYPNDPSKNILHPNFALFEPTLSKKIDMSSIDNFNKSYFQYRQTKDHLEVFPFLQKTFKLPIDIMQKTTIVSYSTRWGKAAPVDLWDKVPGHSDIENQFWMKDFNFKITMCIGNEKYITNNTDELFHTSDKPLKYLQGTYRNHYLFSEQRIYFGANIPMTPTGDIKADIFKENDEKKIYKMILSPGETIYKDPEFYLYKNKGDKKRADKTACYILKDKVQIIDMTDFFKSHPDYIY